MQSKKEEGNGIIHKKKPLRGFFLVGAQSDSNRRHSEPQSAFCVFIIRCFAVIYMSIRQFL